MQRRKHDFLRIDGWRRHRVARVSGPAPLELAEHDDGDAVVLAASGIVDMAAAPALANQVGAVLRRRPHALVIDFTGVTFLATAGMSVLMEANRKCGELAIPFRVVAHGPVTSKPMELLGIDDLLDIYPTVDAALGEIPPGAAHA